ncbi:hypothetical protein [Streptosporangium sp. NPDC000396]|uniref:hypothetical protein n=1 Tax=Streptosporangium sp. NPDC000396 TaxID=3366185 RepID=UPI0036D0328E
MATGYMFSGPVAGGQPYIYYATGAQPATYDVVVGLDQVFSSTPALPIVAGIFTLASASSGLSYTITAAMAAIWNFDASQFDSNGLFRTAVCGNFDQLLVDLDMAGLLPGRLQAIRGWIAQSIPQTFAESLYLRHGFDPVRRCVELTPGMRLRIDFEDHQAVDPGDDLRNGFVGSGTSYVELSGVASQGGGQVVGFDPYLSRLMGLSVAPTSGGAAGVIDLQGAANQLAYWRLFYPSQFPTSDDTGFTGINQNATLIGAGDRTTLEAATSSYVAGTTLPAGAVAAWFRGRASVVPEVPVFLQGVRAYVPVGTTVRDLLCGVMPLPRSTATQVSSHVMTRPYDALVAGSSWAPLTVDTYSDVPLGAQAPWSSALDTFDLPILGGDSLWVPIPSPT